MGITYYEQERMFKLDTKGSSYLIGIVDEEKFIGHVYYGKKLRDYRTGYMLRTQETPFVPSVNERDRVSFMEALPMEYPGHGTGDYREAAFRVKTQAGHTACSLSYHSHKIFAGKKEIPGLPASFARAGEEGCDTLELICRDQVLDLTVVLSYTVFEDTDIIARHVEVRNDGGQPLWLTKVSSVCMDMDNKDFEAITLHGFWARERHIQRRKLGIGTQGIASGRGESGHQDHPFIALVTPNTTQDTGEVYGIQLVYSGNHEFRADVNEYDSVRLQAGINQVDFCWKLEPGAGFYAPEALLTYSDAGLSLLTAHYHDFIRQHVIRSPYKDKKRPILINNWEATYFDFNTEKLLSIAKEAAALGIEMLVLDDGWFGKRNSDNCALGDWAVNEEKLPGGLAYLAAEINKLGMKFGLWFEPEMISPDSCLYREHPDWAIAIPGRTPGRARNQYVLDFSRSEVVDGIWKMMEKVLGAANIEYIKWDMNRPLSDLGSAALSCECQGELSHRYMLGVYALQERLVTTYPHILLENCSSGGARYDAGMLYYSPQIWCSDDTDAIERLLIQEGTALIYPLSTMGAHVSDCPNHTVGRVTPFETRGYVALAGTFGYELDVTRIPEEDRKQIPAQVAMYHKYNDLVREGDYFRLASAAENQMYDSWQVVSKDKTESLVTFIQVKNRAGQRSRRLLLKGLHPEKMYRIEGEDGVYGGDTLMYAGLQVAVMWGDYQGKLIHLLQI